MYIFYLDDAGSAPNPQENNLILGGISVYERHTYWFTQQLDSLAAKIDPINPQSVEFHASEIFSGRNPPWNKFSKKEDRINIIKDILRIVQNSYSKNNAFACEELNRCAVVLANPFPGQNKLTLHFNQS